MSQPTAQPEIGTVFPSFSIRNSLGEESTILAETHGKRSIVHFMRAATCAVCSSHVKNIRQLIQSGEVTNVDFVIVVPGGAEEAATAEKRLGAGLGAIWASGSGHSTAGLGTFLTIQHSGTFVLADDSAILSATTSALPTASYSKQAVVAALSQA